MDTSFTTLAHVIAGHVAGMADTIDGAHLGHAAATSVPHATWVPPLGRDYSGVLTAALDAARVGPVAAVAAALPVGLSWHYSYPPRAGEADLADRIGFAELIGPEGPLMAPACRVGFTLMAPDTLYPLHAHPAIELYLVIAGHAEWRVPEGARIVPPGGTILHATNQPHAMRSFAEPLLALYGWRGDIDTAPVYL